MVNIVPSKYKIILLRNKIRTNASDFLCSIFILLVGSYLLSQLNIPSSLQKTYCITKWYILHPANAWSSVLYAIPKTPMMIKIPLVTLAISSFSLWSNTQPYINFIDVTSIYWVVITTSLYTLPYSKHNYKVIWFINSSTILFISSSIYFDLYHQILLYYDENIIIVTGVVTIVCGIVLSSYYLDNAYFNIGTFFILFGYICKLQTIYYDKYWGTSIFHICTAIGIHFLIYMDKPQLKNVSSNENNSLTPFSIL